jgi:hypothetical protein
VTRAQGRAPSRYGQRIVIAGSAEWTDTTTAIGAVQRLHSLDWGKLRTVLVHRTVSRAEKDAGRAWVLAGGTAEAVDDVGPYVPSAALLVVFINDLAPYPRAQMEAAGHRGVPVLLHHRGRYPYAPGSPQDTAQRATRQDPAPAEALPAVPTAEVA